METTDYVPLKNKARQYQNTKTGEIISLRQFQKIQRGGLTYTQFVKKKGTKRTYKTKGHTSIKIPSKAVRLSQTPALVLRKKAPSKDVQDRVQQMKESWARKRSEEYGVDLSFEDLPLADRSIFWESYHTIMENGVPDRDYYEEELQDLYDMDFQDWLDLNYGDTP